jgi:hypothetical protein
MAEYLAAEVIRRHDLHAPLIWIEHYPEHEGESGEYSLVRFSGWEPVEACLGGVWRYRVGSPWWSPLNAGEVEMLTVGMEKLPSAGPYGHPTKAGSGSHQIELSTLSPKRGLPPLDDLRSRARPV